MPPGSGTAVVNWLNVGVPKDAVVRENVALWLELAVP